jgi:hypothetical protein
VSTPAIKQTEQEPDIFHKTHYMVGEVVLAHQILARKITDLRNQNQSKTAVGQKRAAEEVMRLADQLAACAKIIFDASDKHLKNLR